MMRFNGLAWCLVMVTSGLSQAQVTTTTTTTTTNTEVHRVSQILGSSVQLQGTDNFGKVEDIILDDTGRMTYLVVSNGGQYAMLPWDAGDMNYGRRVVTYNVTQQAVQPFFFQRDALPNVGDPQFTTRVQQVFPNAGALRRGMRRDAVPGDPIDEAKERVREKRGGILKEKAKDRDR